MLRSIGRCVPTVRLSDAAFGARHRALLIVLLVSLPLITALATFGGHGGIFVDDMHHLQGAGGSPDTRHAWLLWLFVAATAVCALAAGLTRSRRAKALTASFGLLLSADALVHGGGGLTDLHLCYVVVLALISLYHDWVVFLLAIALAGTHHIAIALIAPTTVFSDPRAQANPLPYALVHIAFVIGMCVTQFAYWRFTAASQAETDALQERLRYQATHDSLTGLANRTLYAERLESALAGNPKPGTVTVALIDLNEFKGINDSLGHAAGDELLVLTARLLCGSVREADTVARLGGDEFAVLIVDATTESTTAVARIIDAFPPEVELRGWQIAVSASIGVASNRVGTSCDELQHCADIAMYTAKVDRDGPRIRHTTYKPDMTGPMPAPAAPNDLIPVG
jgi:diguanylate cyclase (GGDEF)-like protein